MGAWGIEVLENDAALDLIHKLSKSGNIKSAVEELLVSAEYIDERLLAVEIVDISINGIDKNILGSFYDYEKWFLELKKKPMLDLKDQAISALQYIKANDLNWLPAYKGERAKLLQIIEGRLLGQKPALEEL